MSNCCNDNIVDASPRDIVRVDDTSGESVIAATGSAGGAENEVQALALEIMQEARASLAMTFRFFDAALWRMPTTVAQVQAPLATDGKTLYVNPVMVDLEFVESFSEVARDYLHTLLHCVFQHPFDDEHMNVPAWNLACDVVVEAIALEMCANRFDSPDDERRTHELAALEEILGSLTPTKLYRFFIDAESATALAFSYDFGPSRLWDLRALFARDSHEHWVSAKDQPSTNKDGDEKTVRTRNISDQSKNQEEPSDDAQQDSTTEIKEKQEEQDQADQIDAKQLDVGSQEQQGGGGQADEEGGGQGKDSSDGEEGEAGSQSDGTEGEAKRQFNQPQQVEVDQEEENPDAPEDAAGTAAAAMMRPTEEGAEGGEESGTASSATEMQDAPADGPEMSEERANQQDWERIAKQIEMDLQSFSKKRGAEAGTFMANLAIVNRKQINYTQFLRQFAALGEDLQLNDDEFDYIFYTYGLSHYGNMPLVEPLEYQETYRVREFVIALDTSGSCSGDLVKRFVQHTYEILRETQGFGTQVNVHIVQCDSKVQADDKLTCVEDMDRYCQEFQLYGFGGTDFRPVFEYVEHLQEEEEFENLQGLIYFTDGQGIFPKLPPPYEVAFVFMEEEGKPPAAVPPWAMRVVMGEDEIRSL